MNLGGVVHLNKPGICVVCAISLLFLVYLFSGSDVPSENSSNLVNLRHLLEVAIKAAENGGNEVAGYKDDLNIKSKGKILDGIEDRVTAADYLSHCSMLKTLRNSYPNLAIISEETVECDSNQVVDYSETLSDPLLQKVPNYSENPNDITVWIDPLDATYEYTEKLYDFVTTMVCIAVRGQPLIGVVHKPFSKDDLKTFWAWDGVIPHSNIPFKNEVNRGKKSIVISRSHSGKVREMLDGKIDNYDVVVAAGAGYKALKVATGEADAYLHVTAIKKWDICAGNAIINAARGRMTTMSNETITYNNDLRNVVNNNGLVAAFKDEHDFFIDVFKSQIKSG